MNYILFLFLIIVIIHKVFFTVIEGGGGCSHISSKLNTAQRQRDDYEAKRNKINEYKSIIDANFYSQDSAVTKQTENLNNILKNTIPMSYLYADTYYSKEKELGKYKLGNDSYNEEKRLDFILGGYDDEDEN
jgi:hypothetical protein